MKLSFIISTLTLLLVPGCNRFTQDSDEFQTRDIGVEYRVVATEDGRAVAQATFYSLEGDYHWQDGASIDLVYGDEVLVQRDDAREQRMERDRTDGIIVYSHVFDSNESDEFRFIFERDAYRNEPAPDSYVTLPEPFRVFEPRDGDLYSRYYDDIVVEWDDVGVDSEIDVIAEGDCIREYRDRIESQEGRITIRSGDLRERYEDERDERDERDDRDERRNSDSDYRMCDVRLTLSVEERGQLDRAFGAGSIVAIQSRTVTIRSQP